MITRNYLQLQHGIDSLNLLQLGMMGRYEIIHNIIIMGWIVGILFLVFCLIVRMKMSKNTSKLTVSNPVIESLWLIMPAIVLTSLSVPTLLNLYQTDQQGIFNRMSLKTLGMQWFWSYEVTDNYQPNSDNRFDRYIDPTNYDRLNYLSRRQELHLPNNTEIINIISASDVIHCWTIPNIVLKVDAIPGRVNTVPILFERFNTPSKLYGQCSELCGANHSFMPISIVVS